MKLPALPLRLKILLGLLVVVTAAVSAITFTMARLFHADKAVYVSDLAAVVAMQAARECDVTVSGWRGRLEGCADLADANGIDPATRQDVMRRMLEDLPGVLAVSVTSSGRELLALRDGRALAAAHVPPEAVTRVLGHAAAGRAAGAPAGPATLEVVNARLGSSLPALQLTLRHERPGGGPALVIAALVRIDELMAVAHRSRAFRVTLVGADGVVLAAPSAEVVTRASRASWMPPVSAASAAVVRESVREGEPRFIALAAGRSGIRVAAEIPRAAAYFASRLLLRQLLVVALALLVVAALAATLWARRITRSLTHLRDAAGHVGGGRFDVRVPVEGGDELATLAGSFNRMATELDERDRALRDAQAALIQSEKMAAFGQLGAGIAHEVKNPLAGIQGICQVAQRQLDASHALQPPLRMIETEAKRCRAIIENLLRFSRQERAEHEAVDLKQVVEATASIMEHQLALHRVRIVTAIEADLPLVTGNANQLQQVLMNLALNAQQALDGQPGTFRVEARRGRAGRVELRASDDGPGITAEIRGRIFEPFFTTKPAGQGTGLGLSVSYGIVRDHGGEIRLEDSEGRGTTFVIELPERDEPGLKAAA